MFFSVCQETKFTMFTRHQVSTASTSEEYLVTGFIKSVKDAQEFCSTVYFFQYLVLFFFALYNLCLCFRKAGTNSDNVFPEVQSLRCFLFFLMAFLSACRPFREMVAWCPDIQAHRLRHEMKCEMKCSLFRHFHTSLRGTSTTILKCVSLRQVNKGSLYGHILQNTPNTTMQHD